MRFLSLTYNIHTELIFRIIGWSPKIFNNAILVFFHNAVTLGNNAKECIIIEINVTKTSYVLYDLFSPSCSLLVNLREQSIIT